MSSPNDISRRTLVTSLAGVVAAASGGVKHQPGSSKLLVAFFSRSGNTRVIAGMLARKLRADVFEIERAIPYPVDYLQTVEEARVERNQQVEPALKATVPHIAAYDSIYLGFPIWGETAPPVIRSFLKAHDTAGKTVVPFVTHGGYGLGESHSVLASHAPRARLQTAFSMEADQERRTMEQVDKWLKGNV
jgi:flavodoxin